MYFINILMCLLCIFNKPSVSVKKDGHIFLYGAFIRNNCITVKVNGCEYIQLDPSMKLIESVCDGFMSYRHDNLRVDCVEKKNRVILKFDTNSRAIFSCPNISRVKNILTITSVGFDCCPWLKYIAPSPHITNLIVLSCPKIKYIAGHINLKNFWCFDCSEINFVSDCSNLISIDISHCPKIDFVDAVKIESIKITKSPHLSIKNFC
jgi:hypothetical protein